MPLSNCLITINVNELLGFYDAPRPEERGIHAAAINAVAGEEFGLALLLHYLRSRKVDASLLTNPCTTGKRKGYRLDGWVQTPEVLYQVEVKNWSSHSFGGFPLPLDVTPEEARRCRVRAWNSYWTGATFADAAAAKVLEPMLPPITAANVEPLIVFWASMHPDGEADALFRVPLSDHHFNRVTVFSMSSYLRGLHVSEIHLPLPKALARLNILGRLFQIL